MYLLPNRLICLVPILHLLSTPGQVAFCETQESKEVAHLGMFGLTFGTPAAMNIEAGYVGSGFGLRASGGYLGEVYGVQLNVIVVRWGERGFYRDLSVILGHSTIKRDEWTYLGCSYSLNWRGIFFESGLTVGEGDFDNPQFTAKIGLVPLKEFGRKAN